MEKNTTNIFPNITNIYSDRHYQHLRNEYSILNRYRGDSLGNFSLQLETKLPKINNRLYTLNNREQELQRKSYLLQKQNIQTKNMEKQINDMKYYLLNQEKTRQHSCCCNGSANSQLMYPPMLMNSMMYGQPNMNYPHNNCKSCGQHVNQQKPHRRQSNQSKQNPLKETSSTINSNKKKKPNSNRKSLLARFRKAAYAVYFCIYLKNFSVKFTKNRYQLFKDRYLLNYGQKVKEDSYKITKSFEVIDIFEIIKSSPVSMDNFSSLELSSAKAIDNKKFSKKKQKPLIPKSRADRFSKALNFINLYIKKLETIILRDKFLQYYGEIISIGTLNQSFFMDDLLIPQQIQIITFSQKKGFAQIDTQTEKILLMIYIFVKHLLFKVLFKIKEKKILQKKVKEEEYEKYKQNLDQVYQFLEMVSLIIYSLINNIYTEHLDQRGAESNYDSLKSRFKVQPAKILSTPNCPKKLKEQINYRQLIVGVNMDEGFFHQLQREQHEDYLGFIVGQIQDFIEKLRIKTKQVNKLIYDHVRETTLQEQYIIFEGLKAEEQQMQKSMKQLKNNKNSRKSRDSDFSGPSNTSLGNISKKGRKGKK